MKYILNNNNYVLNMGNNVITTLPWTPKAISTTGWYDASDASTITMGTIGVSAWADKSGNGNHMLQSTASRQPAYITNDTMYSGRPSLSGGSSWRYMATTNSLPATKTIYMVLYYGTGVETSFENHNQIIGNPVATDVRITGRAPLPARSVWDDQNDFDDAGDFKNGSNTNIKGITNSATPMPATLWRFESSASWTQRWNVLGNAAASFTYWYGGVGEIVMTNGLENINTKKKVEGYLAWKWGLVNNLPSDHPYKTVPPAP